MDDDDEKKNDFFVQNLCRWISPNNSYIDVLADLIDRHMLEANEKKSDCFFKYLEFCTMFHGFSHRMILLFAGLVTHGHTETFLKQHKTKKKEYHCTHHS